MRKTSTLNRFSYRDAGRLVAIVSAAAGLVYAATAQSWAPACDETRAGAYVFEGLGGPAERPVRISLCKEAKCVNPVEFATVTGNGYTALRPAGMARPYFLVQRQGERRVIAARRLALEGAYNFRDLGGLRTMDGKTVRWGQVFRSDTLTRLTSADYERLNAIGISLVCDLRTRQERQTDPTEWQNASPVFVLAPVSENEHGASLNGTFLNDLQSGKMTVEEGRKTFEKFYVRMVFDSASKFGSVLRAIATSDRPSMFHCTGGRDRTGITAAILLHILGVPKEMIISDFVLSTQYLNERPNASFAPAGLEPDKARVYVEVIELQPRYIEAIFQAIDKRYGSFDRYRRDALHITDADVAALRTRLLE